MLKINLEGLHGVKDKIMQQFQTMDVKQLKLSKKHALIYAPIVAVVIILLVVFSLNSHQTRTLKAKTLIETKVPNNNFNESLEDISAKLANLETKLASGGAVVNLDSLRKEVQQIQKQSDQLVHRSNELIKKEIESSNQVLVEKLESISGELKKLQDEKKQTTFLKSRDLPFKVISVDNIQQHNIVTVSYDHTVFPMDVGDYLAEWKLISADFVQQKAEFSNKRDQHIVIDLNRIEKGSS
jgi:seryl-tRNA synthetase